MAFIVEQLAGDKGIQLGYEDVVRPFSFGTNWSKIRVGVLWAMNGYSVMPDATLPYIGICTGSTSRLSASSTDALWVPYSYSFAQVLMGGTAPARYYQFGNGTSGNVPIQRVGTTSTSLSANLSPTMYSQMSANPSNHYTACMFTVTKGTVGAAAIGCDMIYHSAGAGAGAVGVSRGTFLAAMESENAAISPMSRLSATSTNLPLRFDKDWDSMFVGWIRATPTICVSCMTVVRFA